MKQNYLHIEFHLPKDNTGYFHLSTNSIWIYSQEFSYSHLLTLLQNGNSCSILKIKNELEKFIDKTPYNAGIQQLMNCLREVGAIGYDEVIIRTRQQSIDVTSQNIQVEFHKSGIVYTSGMNFADIVNHINTTPGIYETENLANEIDPYDRTICPIVNLQQIVHEYIEKIGESNVDDDILKLREEIEFYIKQDGYKVVMVGD